MKNEHIKKLILHLDDDSPYLAEIYHRYFRHQKSLSIQDRLVYSMGDPAFGIHFIRAYHRAGAWLPNEVWWTSVWRGFCCLRYDQELRGQDDHCFEALALGHPANRAKQALIKGLLCSGLSYDQVGEWVGMSSDTIKVFSHLYFDFLERQDDDTFVVQVLNPRSHLSMLNTKENKTLDPLRLVMRIGYCFGPEAVLKVLGLSNKWNDAEQEGQPVTNIKDALLSSGQIKARLGLLASDDPAFTLVKTLIAEDAKYHPDGMDNDWKMGLGALSMDQSAQHVLKGIVMGAAAERLKAQREYDAQAAAEEAKRKAPEARGPAGVPAGQPAA